MEDREVDRLGMDAVSLIGLALGELLFPIDWLVGCHYCPRFFPGFQGPDVNHFVVFISPALPLVDFILC